MSTPYKILQSGLLVFLLVLIAKFLALIKDIILAYYFGQGELTDTYFIAFQIPNALMYILGIDLLRGMTSSIFSGSLAQKRMQDLSVQFSTIFNGAFLLTFVVSIIGIWKMPALIRIIPFTFQDSSFEMTVLLGRLLFPFLMVFGLSTYLGATLNAFRNFFLPGLSLIIANIIMIVSLLFLADSLSIVSLAYGTITGFTLACVIQFIYIVKTKIPYKISAFNFLIEPVRNYFRKSLPLLLVTSLAQLTIFTGFIIALKIDEGMVSALSYAGKINELSLSLFVLPLLTVLLPEFSRNKAVNNIEKLKTNIRFGIEVIATVIVFWISFITVFYREVIYILFQRGEFTALNTMLTSDILMIYIIGICFQSAHLFFVFVYLGMQKTKALTLIGISAYIINIGLLLFLSNKYGVLGIAWASTITSIIYSFLLIITFKHLYINFSILKHSKRLIKIVGAGIVLFVLFFIAHEILMSKEINSLFSMISWLFLIVFAGIIIYVTFLNMLRVYTIKNIVTGVRNYIHG